MTRKYMPHDWRTGYIGGRETRICVDCNIDWDTHMRKVHSDSMLSADCYAHRVSQFVTPETFQYAAAQATAAAEYRVRQFATAGSLADDMTVEHSLLGA